MQKFQSNILNSFNQFVNLNVPNHSSAEIKPLVFFSLNKKPTLKNLFQDRESHLNNSRKRVSILANQPTNKTANKVLARPHSPSNDHTLQDCSQQLMEFKNEQSFRIESEIMKPPSAIFESSYIESLRRLVNNNNNTSFISDMRSQTINPDSTEEEPLVRSRTTVLALMDRSISAHRPMLMPCPKKRKESYKNNRIDETEKAEMRQALLKNILEGNISIDKKEDSLLSTTLSSTLGHKSSCVDRINRKARKETQKLKTFEETFE